MHYQLTINFLNFEQDLGVEALRFAKRSYQPDMIVTKYRVSYP
jgi:hypothetical protein